MTVAAAWFQFFFGGGGSRFMGWPPRGENTTAITIVGLAVFWLPQGFAGLCCRGSPKIAPLGLPYLCAYFR